MSGAGDYVDYLVLQSPTISTSTRSGHQKPVYVDDASGTGVWGKVEQLSANEKLIAGLSVQSEPVKIRLNGHPEITRQHRLIDQRRNSIYKIEAIQWLETETWITAQRANGIR